jgi:hypothetical protein
MVAVFPIDADKPITQGGHMSRRNGSGREAARRIFARSRALAGTFFKGADAPDGLLDRIARALMPKASNRVHTDLLLPLKHERLGHLAGAGFNVAPYAAWPRNELKLDELWKFFDRHGVVSLRNFTEESASPHAPSPRLPVLYEQRDWDAVASFCIEHNRRYHTLVNQTIPLDDSVYAGNLVLLPGGQYVISYFSGRGTPRDVDDKANEAPLELRMFIREHGAPLPPDVPSELRLIGEKALEFLPARRPITLEFSVYPYPVGTLGHCEVFWEWRAGSMNDLFVLLKGVCEQSSSSDVHVVMNGSAK